MIRILLVRSKDGLLQSCSAEGHAGFAKKGKDIVCASVSNLLRTVVMLLEKEEAVELEEKSSGRGSLAFSVKNYSSDENSSNESLLKYSFEILNLGIGQIQKEFPDCVSLQVVEL